MQIHLFCEMFHGPDILIISSSFGSHFVAFLIHFPKLKDNQTVTPYNLGNHQQMSILLLTLLYSPKCRNSPNFHYLIPVFLDSKFLQSGEFLKEIQVKMQIHLFCEMFHGSDILTISSSFVSPLCSIYHQFPHNEGFVQVISNNLGKLSYPTMGETEFPQNG